QRYASASALAEDLRRFLADRPIQARRSSWRERTWRWCHRNPALAFATSAAGLLLVTIAIGSLAAAWQLRKEQNATRQQLHETQEAEGVAKGRLYDSLADQARASRLSRRLGQRFQTLEVLAEAAQMARDMNLPEKEFLKLRNEA